MPPLPLRFSDEFSGPVAQSSVVGAVLDEVAAHAAAGVEPVALGSRKITRPAVVDERLGEKLYSRGVDGAAFHSRSGFGQPVFVRMPETSVHTPGVPLPQPPWRNRSASV